jgi:sporulation protein YlmC with PRC-barrel domain
MLIEAGTLRNSKVQTKDGIDVGNVQNVLFDVDPQADSVAAFVLIFPSQQNWFKQYVKQNWGRIGIETVKILIPSEAAQIVKDVEAKGEQEALKIWKVYLDVNAAKIQLALKRCHLIPCNEIDPNTVSKGQVNLKTNSNDIEDYGSFGFPLMAEGSQTMLAFYSAPNMPMIDQSSMLPIALNKTPLHGKSIIDSERQKGWIFDMQLEIENGVVDSFIVSTTGQGAGKRAVPIKDVNFDTLKMKKGKSFKNCSLLKC